MCGQGRRGRIISYLALAALPSLSVWFLHGVVWTRSFAGALDLVTKRLGKATITPYTPLHMHCIPSTTGSRTSQCELLMQATAAQAWVYQASRCLAIASVQAPHPYTLMAQHPLGTLSLTHPGRPDRLALGAPGSTCSGAALARVAPDLLRGQQVAGAGRPGGARVRHDRVLRPETPRTARGTAWASPRAALASPAPGVAPGMQPAARTTSWPFSPAMRVLGSP